MYHIYILKQLTLCVTAYMKIWPFAKRLHFKAIQNKKGLLNKAKMKLLLMFGFVE